MTVYDTVTSPALPWREMGVPKKWGCRAIAGAADRLKRSLLFCRPSRAWPISQRILVLLVQLTLLSGTSYGEDLNQTLSLDACISIALNNHPAIKASQANYCGASDQVDVARSYLGPDVQAKVDYTFTNEPQTVDVNLFSGQLGDRLLEAASFFEIARQAGGGTAVGALNDLNGPAFAQTKQALAAQLPSTIRADLLGRNSIDSQVRLIQPLWTHGKITARYQQARAGAAIARDDIVGTRDLVAFNVSQAYLTVVMSDELGKVAADAGGYAAGVEEMAQSLVSDGDPYVSTADVWRSRTFRALFQEQAVGLQVSRQRALAGLKLAMGIDQVACIDVADHALSTDAVDLDVDLLKQQAVDQRPELNKANGAVKVADLERSIARSEYFPNVAAFASFNSITDDANYPNPTNPNQWAVGVTATMPLMNSGRTAAQVRQASHAVCGATEQRQLLRQLVEQQVEDAFLEVQEMSKRRHEAAIAVQSAEQTQDAFRSKFEAGVVPPAAVPKFYEDLLTTRLMLVTAQVRYVQARFGYNAALAKLDLAVGADPQVHADCEPGNESATPGNPAPADFSARNLRQ